MTNRPDGEYGGALRLGLAPQPPQIDGQWRPRRIDDLFVAAPFRDDMPGRPVGALTDQSASARIDDPIVLHAKREVAGGFRHAVVARTGRRENLDNEQRRTLYSTWRKLRRVGDDQQ